MGLANVPYNNEEMIFLGSLAIVTFLLQRLTNELSPSVRKKLIGTALVIFAIRAIPSTGAASTWWMIDDLGFDQQFLSKLSLISSGLTLFGMFILPRFRAERTITEIITFLAMILTVLSLPEIALYYGFHDLTQAHTANSAPPQLKATYFAVIAALINLALSLSQLLTKWLNQWFIVTCEVKDPLRGTVTISADNSQLGGLFFTAMFLGFAIPMLTIFIAKRTLLYQSEPKV